MSKGFIIAMGLFSILFGSCSKKSAGLPEQPASKYRAGQVWTFKAPASQPHARLTVLRVDNGDKLGTIVHIALSGVSYGNGHTRIQHLPFAESAMDRSVTALEQESGPVPDFTEGYQLWREAFDAGQGGVFTITVAEAFEAVTDIAQNQN